MKTNTSDRFKRSTAATKPAIRKVARPKSQTGTHLDLFKDFIGMVKDGPRDLARNHTRLGRR